MTIGMLRTVPWGILALALTTTAFAQEAEQDQPGSVEGTTDAQASATAQVGGEVGGEAQVGGETHVGLGLPGGAPAGATTAAAAVAPPPGPTDHETVVGRAAVGFLGVSQLAVGADPANGNVFANVPAPVVGVRYWLNPGMGLDLGLGFGMQGGSATVEAGGDEEKTDAPSSWALILHGGVPLALSWGRHYTFTIIPELDVGFGSGSSEEDGVDVDHSGFLLSLGARAGAEVQFGFIGIPELSLQASIGARYALNSRTTSVDDNSFNVKDYSLRTAVYNSPWSIFTSSVAAFYYF